MTERLMLAQISVDIRNLEKQLQKSGRLVDISSRRMERSWNKATGKMSRDTEAFGRDVRRAISAIALATVAGEVADLADAWTEASNQISAAAQASGTAAVSLSRIADVAKDTRTEFDATATLYARLTRATGELGASQEQVVDATRLINEAFVAGGASANEQRSAILQLSQALQSGVLQGDELRSLRESSPLLLAAIAKEFNVAQGALKKLGAEGKLTSDRIFEAILKAAPEIEAQFSVTQSTLDSSFTNLRTAAIEYAGTTNQALGVTASLGSVVNNVADNFESFADAMLIAVTILGARGLGGALNHAASAMGGFFAGIPARQRETIRSLEKTRDAATETAKTQLQLVEKETENLRKVGKERDRLSKIVQKGTRLTEQYNIIAAANDSVVAAEQNLNRVLQDRTATEAQVTEARNRLTAAQARYNSVTQNQFKNVARLRAMEEETVATTNRLTTAKNSLTAAQRASAIASQNLAKATSILNSGMKGLLAFFGGPIGLAITAAGAAMAYFSYETIKAERAVRNMQSALDILARANLENIGLMDDASGASAELTEHLKNQKAATEALAEIERRRTRTDYIKGLKGARDEVKRLKDAVEVLENQVAEAKAFEKFGDKSVPKWQDELQKANEELADTIRYVGILETGLEALEAIDFELGKASTDLPGKTENPLADDVKNIADGIREQQAERERLAKLEISNTEDLMKRLREDWRELYEGREAAIKRELSENLAAIDKAKRSEADKETARRQAQDIYFGKMAELYAEAEANAKQLSEVEKQQAAAEGQYLLSVMASRDQMFGHFITLSSREYDARRRDIEANIQDEVTRVAALRELADEESEFRRRAREETFKLDDRSDPKSKIDDVKAAEDEKLIALQDALANEIITLQEHAELKKEIERDTQAEILAIQASAQQAQLAGAQSLFGGLASLAEAFAGKSSGIYKAMFAAQQAAALASAYVQMELAVAKANAAAPPPLNAPLILAARVQGLASIAGIAAQTVAGFKSGGFTGVGGDDEEAGIVHKNEYVFNAKQTRRIGRTNLEAIAKGRAPSFGSVPAAVSPSRMGSFSFGDMNVSISGNGADEIREELASTLMAHRRGIMRDVKKSFGGNLETETKRTLARHERPRT